jgi:hypothetical protein
MFNEVLSATRMADWVPPVDIPPGWEVACAPRPIDGPLIWRGEDRGHGEFYAAPPNGAEEQTPRSVPDESHFYPERTVASHPAPAGRWKCAGGQPRRSAARGATRPAW